MKRDYGDGKEYRGSTRRDNDTRPIPPQRVCLVIRASLFESFGFSANFLPSPRSRGTASRQSSIFRITKSCSPLLPLFHSTSSSLLYLATSVLTLIPGDPSTRVVALITCRKCFSSMREKGSPSRRIGVFRFVFSFFFSLFSLFFFFFWRGTPCGGRGVQRDVQMGTGDFPGLGGRDLENGLRVHDARFFFFFHSSTWTRTAQISNPT